MKNYVGQIVFCGSVALLTAGCATDGGSVSSDKAAVEKSKAYFDTMNYVLAGTAGGVCAPPTAAQKVSMSSSDGPSKEWRDLLTKASACAGDKNWKMLDQVAETLARIDINAPWGAYFLSVSAEGKGDFQRAIWMLELAQKKAGNTVGLFTYEHGRILLGLKDTVHAMSDVKKAVALEPRLTMGHLFLAQIYQRDLEWDLAGEHFASVLALEDHNLIALAGLAEVRFNQGKPADSAELYSKAISLSGSHLEWWLRLGSLYETQLKNAELALNTYKGLRSSLDKGVVKQRPSVDLNAKIKTLEETMTAARQPAAQASAAKIDQDRSKK